MQGVMVLTAWALENRGLNTAGDTSLPDSFSDKGKVTDYAIGNVTALV